MATAPAGDWGLMYVSPAFARVPFARLALLMREAFRDSVSEAERSLLLRIASQQAKEGDELSRMDDWQGILLDAAIWLDVNLDAVPEETIVVSALALAVACRAGEPDSPMGDARITARFLYAATKLCEQERLAAGAFLLWAGSQNEVLNDIFLRIACAQLASSSGEELLSTTLADVGEVMHERAESCTFALPTALGASETDKIGMQFVETGDC